MNGMSPIEIVRLAHAETTGDQIANPTAAELWMAHRIRELTEGVSHGYLRANPGRKVEAKRKGEKPIEDPTITGVLK